MSLTECLLLIDDGVKCYLESDMWLDLMKFKDFLLVATGRLVGSFSH